MSFSPSRVQMSLQNEIQKRINYESPTKYDIDFYLRKINRLENDLNQSQDQLSKVRVRLRKAEDYQIKYDLILRQNTMINGELQKKQKQCHNYKYKEQAARNQFDELSYQVQNWLNQKKMLLQQIQILKNKCNQCEEKKKQETITLNERVDHHIKNQIQQLNKQYAQYQQQLQSQIQHLKKLLLEKEANENMIANKIQKIRKDKDFEIQRLNKIIEQKKQQEIKIIKQKNDEIDKLREKFQKIVNFQMENIKNDCNNSQQVFFIQINGLKQLLTIKNEQISKLLKQIKSITELHDLQRDNFNKQINLFKDKIYKIQRQNQLQLYNIKQRLSKIHALEIEQSEKKFNEIINNLKQDKKNLDKIIKQKQKIMDSQRKEQERANAQNIDKLKQRQSRITHLQQKIKQSNTMNDTEVKNLHESFHKIQTQKQSMSNDYQANVGFLNQQIAKLTSTIDIKNTQIKALHEEIALIKKQNAQNLKEVQNGWKQDREERGKERQRERQKRQKMQDEMRLKQKQWKTKQRQLNRLRQKQQRQKSKLKYINDELQKDVQRLHQYIKNIDDNLKKQMKKNQMSTLDTGGIRRQLTSEMERQKSQLQAIKRMEVDSIKKKWQIEQTRLANENERLHTDLLKKQLAYQQLQAEFKKLEHINKNIDKINKETLIEYQKKMATLNNEILLAQNLYKSFMDAKARQKENLQPKI